MDHHYTGTEGECLMYRISKKGQRGGEAIAIPLGSSMGARGACRLQDERGQVLDEIHTAHTHTKTKP